MQRIKFNALAASLVLSSLSTHAEPVKPAPHSFPEYSKRFTTNAFAPIRTPGKVFHVSAEKGNDSNLGSQKAPFKTLQAARDAIRQYKKSQGLPKGGIQVLIAAGHYHPAKTLQLSQKDSGTHESPIVWKGVNRDQVTISGGTELDATKFAPLDAQERIDQLHPNARGKLLSLDLSNINLTRVFGKKGNYGQLSMDGQILQLAQWPNRGYHHIGKILDKGPVTRWMKPGEKPPAYSENNPSGGKFIFKESLSPAVTREFQRTRDMRLEGYFHNDWYFQNEPVGKIDGETIQLLRHTRYGVVDHIKSLPRRVRIVNVLAELDEPGEWYIDRQIKKLYVWPIKGFDPARSSVSVPNGPTLLSLKNTQFITFRDAIFENTGRLAIQINGGQYNLIANSIIRNGASRGLNISGGRRNGITACEIYGLNNAFGLSGGNIKTLERCYNFATNNDIHSCRKRGYGMIGLSGAGLYFAHNRLHDMNGAVSYNTVDLLMEYNEYYNIGYEMGDFNVAYCGAKWHTMNNVLRYNFVHHLLEPGGHPVSPFRNDDGGAGLKIYGNVFYRAGRCAGQFHGPANDLQNNIALHMPIFWWTLKKPIDPKGIEKSWSRLARFGSDLPKGSKEDYLYNLEKKIGKNAWLKSPWKEQFPEVAEFIKINPWAQTFCHVTDNYAHAVRKPFHIHGGSGTVKGMESKKEGAFKDLPNTGSFELPKPIELNAFVDVESLNFQFKPSFQPMANFKPIPFQKIGLHNSAYRSNAPKKSTYRSVVYQKFKNDKKRGYDPKVVNARYPTPSYLK